MKKSKVSLPRKSITHMLFLLLSLCCVIPILYVLSASFTSEQGISENGYTLIPSIFSTEAYEYVLASPESLLTSYAITITVTLIGTTLSLLLTSMLAYAISRRDFPLHRKLSFLVFFCMLFNGGMVPSYILITKYYHLNDTLMALILPYTIVPWNVFLMRSFFTDLPQSLLDSAKLDGCSEIGTFFRIAVPISKPAFATVGLFIAFAYWNDWWLSMMYTTKTELVSLQYYLYRIMNSIEFLTSSLASNVTVNTSLLPSATARMALCVLAAGPMLLIFPFFQKYFVKGLTVGAVKE